MKILNFEQFLNEAFLFGDYPAHRPYGDKTPIKKKKFGNHMSDEQKDVLAKLDEKYPDLRFNQNAIFDVTKEEYDYAIARSKTFTEMQTEPDGSLKKNAVNGLIAEVTIAHRLYEMGFLKEWQDESLEVHASDGGVDIPLYDFDSKRIIPCDVKCCTFKDGELNANAQISVYKMGKYAEEDLKHSFYLICTGYSENEGSYGRVYLIGVIETGTFISMAKKNGQIDTVKNGYRYWIQCNQLIEKRKRVSSLNQLVYHSIPWQSYFEKYDKQLEIQDAKKARRLAKYKEYYDKLNVKDLENKE